MRRTADGRSRKPAHDANRPQRAPWHRDGLYNAFMTQARDTTAPEELVVLVHGTFANDRDGGDEGERWWQRGSRAWQRLQDALPPGTRLPPANARLFHWSGRNSHVDRWAASIKLLARLLQLERDGYSYHLVGHSHGGSVMWEAMVTSVELRRR